MHGLFFRYRLRVSTLDLGIAPLDLVDPCRLDTVIGRNILIQTHDEAMGKPRPLRLREFRSSDSISFSGRAMYPDYSRSERFYRALSLSAPPR